MKSSLVLGSAIALVTLVALACSGDREGNEEAVITTEKGLSVAALAAGFSAGQADDGGAESPAQPVPVSAIGAQGRDYAFPDYGVSSGPLQQQVPMGIAIQGFGSAAVDADMAVLELNFDVGFYYDESFPEPPPSDDGQRAGEGEATSVGFEPVPPEEVEPITEEGLAPVVDAIVATGVARDDIEFIGGFYYDAYSSSAILRVTVRDLDALEAIVEAAKTVSTGLGEIWLQGSSVSYAVVDCASLERAVLEAAVGDAGARAAIFADALGVGLGAVIGASQYTYSFFGLNPCDSTFGGPYPFGGISYVPGQLAQVQLISNVSITYAVR